MTNKKNFYSFFIPFVFAFTPLFIHDLINFKRGQISVNEFSISFASLVCGILTFAAIQFISYSFFIKK